jgi:hypothetical protein
LKNRYKYEENTNDKIPRSPLAFSSPIYADDDDKHSDPQDDDGDYSRVEEDLSQKRFEFFDGIFFLFWSLFFIFDDDIINNNNNNNNNDDSNTASINNSFSESVTNFNNYNNMMKSNNNGDDPMSSCDVKILYEHFDQALNKIRPSVSQKVSKEGLLSFFTFQLYLY